MEQDERIEIQELDEGREDGRRRFREGVGGILRYVLPIAIVILLAIVIFQNFFAGGRGKAKTTDIAKIEERATAIVRKGIVIPGPTLIVNLADRTVPRFLKISLVFEVDSPVTASEIIEKEPMVKDSLITLLSSKTMQEILGVENMQVLKEEIVARLNSILDSGLVLNVYFTEFVVQ